MTDQITIRPTRADDLAAVDALLAASYPILLKPDYPPSVLVTAIPLISRARPELLRCGSYYLAQDAQGQVLAAVGWTQGGPQGGVGPRELGHVRHLVTHPKATRRGLARTLLNHCFDQARAAGITRLSCQSTRTAVALYQAMGFASVGEIEIMLRPGITFPAVQMQRAI
jgi:ribosomal protein S18 acetylase RimI-like enzyme